jgi:RNA polymerase sigma-70 factor, ECF subfamily
MTTSFNQLNVTAATEDEMLYCLNSNDPRKFSKLYDHFSEALFGLLLRWVKDKGVAENLLQDVFIKAWRNREKYQTDKGRIFTWLYRITRNICIDYMRSRSCKQNKASVYSDDQPAFLQLPANDTIQPDTIGIRKLVEMLRQEEKEVVEMMYFIGMTQRQIAEQINIPLGTVKTRMNKAIKELRYFYKKDWKQARVFISLN